MPNAWDSDDPRNWEPDEEQEPLCPECGGPCQRGHKANIHPACGGTPDECRCGPTAQPEPKQDHILVCQVCDGTGWISLYSTPYGSGWGVVAEAVPCACRYPKANSDRLEPEEYTRRRIIQHARKYLSERDLEYPAPPKPPEEDE